VHRLLGGHIEQMDDGLREPLLDRLAPISVCQRPRDHRELIGGVVSITRDPEMDVVEVSARDAVTINFAGQLAKCSDQRPQLV
jgi:hypothetical protein